MPVNRNGLRAALMALLSALALWLAVSPEPAAANAHCSATPQPLNFGTSLTTTGVVNYSCINQNPTVTTFTLCLRVGTSSYPGTADQPRLQYQGNALDFNLYRDAAATSQPWTATNYFTLSVTIPAGIGQTVTGSFLYYARIRAGQIVPNGTYTGQLFNTLLGFQTTPGQCLLNVAPNFQGQDFTINVSASIAPGCTLGTIGGIDFGTQPGLVQRADAAGSVQLTCPLNRAWTLSFGGGNYASGSVRRMRSPSAYYVPYTLYRNAARDNPIAINGTVTGTGTGAAQTTNVYGRVEPATPPPVGVYQDTVVVTLSF